MPAKSAPSHRSRSSRHFPNAEPGQPVASLPDRHHFAWEAAPRPDSLRQRSQARRSRKAGGSSKVHRPSDAPPRRRTMPGKGVFVHPAAVPKRRCWLPTNMLLHARHEIRPHLAGAVWPRSRSMKALIVPVIPPALGPGGFLRSRTFLAGGGEINGRRQRRAASALKVTWFRSLQPNLFFPPFPPPGPTNQFV